MRNYLQKMALAGAALLLVGACTSVRPMVDTPNIYGGGAYPAEEIPDALQSPTVEVIYVSDRSLEENDDGLIEYGDDRSRSMGFGAVTIEIGKDQSWDEIVTASSALKREKKIPLTLKQTLEIGRLPATPLSFSVVEGESVENPETRAHYDKSLEGLQAQIVSKLAAANEKEIVLFVHGFNTPFDEAAFVMAEIWHFSGRHGVPMIYTWPAGSGGLFGYFGGRESGQYTVFHFKEFMRLLAATPEAERIHIITHSRGSDVATTALRELVIEARAGGLSPREEFRIENLIMAAPDLDLGVVQQRLVAENFAPAVGQISIYTSPKDGALWISEILMRGMRVGRINSDEISADDVRTFAGVKNVNFIDIEDPPGFIRHSYFREDPGVLSDIITLITKRSFPTDAARPLQRLHGNFWRMPDEYLIPE